MTLKPIVWAGAVAALFGFLAALFLVVTSDGDWWAIVTLGAFTMVGGGFIVWSMDRKEVRT